MKTVSGAVFWLVVAAACLAGVERVLLEQPYGECTVRVVHDAVPGDDEGTLLFRSNQKIDNLLHPCGIGGDEAREALSRGLAAYLAADDLKPVTSIMIGRIMYYPWISRALEAQGGSGGRARLSHEEFNRLVMSPEVAGPFQRAARDNGLAISGASCEKLIFSVDGAPLDGLCGYRLEAH